MAARNAIVKSASLFEALESRRLMSSSISGTVFNESDSDGRREAGEQGVPSQRVFIDANFDGKFQSTEKTTLTKSDGSYAFKNLTSGVYRVRLVSTSHYRQTAPGLLYYDIAANGNDMSVANDFGLTRTAVVRGTVFSDKNGDGKQSSSEAGLANVRVYVDANNNGKFDTGERSRLTDSHGHYRLAGLTAGRYVIRAVSGKHVTTSARGYVVAKVADAESLSNRLFGLK